MMRIFRITTVAFRRHDCGSSLRLPRGWNRFLSSAAAPLPCPRIHPRTFDPPARRPAGRLAVERTHFWRYHAPVQSGEFAMRHPRLSSMHSGRDCMRDPRRARAAVRASADARPATAACRNPCSRPARPLQAGADRPAGRGDRSDLRAVPQAARRHRAEEGPRRARPPGRGELLLDPGGRRRGGQEQVRHRQPRAGHRPRRPGCARLGGDCRLRGRAHRHERPAASGRASARRASRASTKRRPTNSPIRRRPTPPTGAIRPRTASRCGPIAQANAPVVDKLGLHLVRVLPDDSPANVVTVTFVKVMTPTGKIGFVPIDFGPAAGRRADVLRQGRQRLEDRRLCRRRAQPLTLMQPGGSICWSDHERGSWSPAFSVFCYDAERQTATAS